MTTLFRRRTLIETGNVHHQGFHIPYNALTNTLPRLKAFLLNVTS